MNSPQGPWSDPELQQQRESIRQGLLRANTAALAITVLVLLVALAALVQAYRANDHRLRAEVARQDATDKLWNSSLSQARYARISRTDGQRFEALKAIGEAARIKPTLDLRNEAIAALALPDLRYERPIINFGNIVHPPCSFDEANRRAVFSTNGAAQVVDVHGGGVLKTFTNLSGVTHVRISPSGDWVALQAGRRLTLWNIEADQSQLEINIPWSSAWSFSRSNRWYFTGLDRENARLIDLQHPGSSQNLKLTNVFRSAFHPDNRYLAVYDHAKTIHLFSLPELKLIRTYPFPDDVHELVWSGRGALLAGACEDGNAYLLDLRTGSLQALRGHTRSVYSVRFNHDGSLLASTSHDATTRFWDPETGANFLTTPRGGPLSFSGPDSRVSMGRFPADFSLWQAASPREFRILAVPKGYLPEIRSIEFSPDGRLLAAAGYNGLALWDVESGKLFDFLNDPHGRSVYFLPGGREILTSSQGGLFRRQLQMETNSNRVSFGPATRIPLKHAGEHGWVAPSPDWKKFVINLNSSRGLLVNMENVEDQRLIEGQSGFSNPAFSPDGKTFAVGTWKGVGTWVWDAETVQPVKKFSDLSGAPFYSPDGRWLVVAGATESVLYDGKTWEQLATFPREMIGEANGFGTFSDDGKLLAIQATAHHIQLIDPVQRTRLALLTSPDPKLITKMSFNAGATMLAVACENSVQIWNLGLIRQQLRQWNLDWESNDPGNFEGGLTRLSNAVPSGLGMVGQQSPIQGWLSHRDTFNLVAVAVMLLAIGLGAFLLQRQRRLMEGYLQIDQLASQRQRELAVVQSELLHSQKMKALGTLAAGIAHDFNNLLSVIRMANKLSMRETADNPEVQSNLQMVEQAVVQGKNVVSSMLGYSRDESEPGQPYSVAEVVEDSVPLLSKQFLSGIALTLDLDYQAPPIRSSSRGRLQQILLNLIVNASEAMKGQGNLLMRVARGNLGSDAFILRPAEAPAYVQIEVSDSGPGIAPEIVDRIFEPFFTTKMAGSVRGTGLGLSMVFSIAQQDQLGIRLVNRPGQGASFFLLIPAEPRRLES